jgi:hypothetical protein
VAPPNDDSRTRRPRAIAINVGVNTRLPGFRAPVRPDGSFEYVPIPEREPTLPAADLERPVPTYADLDCPLSLPDDLADRRVHVDPALPDHAAYDGPEYTYGDEHAIKAGPLSALEPADHLLFYATLDSAAGVDSPSLGGSPPPAGVRPAWMAPDWGAYLVATFRVVRAVTGERYHDLESDERRRFRDNAHLKREAFDARVLVLGDPDDSRLLDAAVPLSTPSAGSEANWLVTDLSNDSGGGPWWRRPLRFGPDATERLLATVEDGPAATLR